MACVLDWFRMTFPLPLTRPLIKILERAAWMLVSSPLTAGGEIALVQGTRVDNSMVGIELCAL